MVALLDIKKGEYSATDIPFSVDNLWFKYSEIGEFDLEGDLYKKVIELQSQLKEKEAENVRLKLQVKD